MSRGRGNTIPSGNTARVACRRYQPLGSCGRSVMKLKHDGVAMKKSTKEKRRKIDKQVGNQLRTGRLIRGLSQQALAEQVDLTFQQLQKYERGTNRMFLQG